MKIQPFVKKKGMFGIAVILSSLLVGCQTGPDQSESIQGIVLEQNAGWGVVGSTVMLYQDDQLLSESKTGADGRFKFSNIKVGTYNFKVRKTGMAGTDIYGYVVTDKTNDIRIVQRKAFDPSADPTPPQLNLFRKDGQTPLANTTFTDKMDMKFDLAKDSNHIPPLRLMIAQIDRTPGSGYVQGGSNHGGWVKRFGDIAETSSGELEFPEKENPTNFLKGHGSREGDKLFIEVMAVDLNYNIARYYVPIVYKVTGDELKNKVVAPTKAAATAITLRYEGGSASSPYAVSGPTTQAANKNTNLYVELRWCYTNEDKAATPFAFDIERSLDQGKTFSKIGAVGGASAKECPENPMTRPFFFRDNGPELAVGKTAHYRVVARASNMLTSNVTQTTPLAEFKPSLNSPTEEEKNVPLQPIFKISSPQLEIGADGVAYNLRVADKKGAAIAGLPGVTQNDLFRVEEGTGDKGNKVPEGQSLVFIQRGPWVGMPRKGTLITTDTAGIYNDKKPNLLPIDSGKHEVSIPRALLIKEPLQSFRNYSVELYSAFAYKYQANEDYRISAYSVYTWPLPRSGPPIAPIYAGRSVTDVYDFVTGDGKNKEE